MKRIIAVVLSICFLFAGCKTDTSAKILNNTTSKDGTMIAYSVYGQGEVSLVFVHGWSCDGRYWCEQVPYFSKKYQVVTIDLAGHGNSGLGRETYTMEAFGQDVSAVLQAVNAKKAILIGHSMGGAVILNAANIAPEKVIGLIGVDTLQDMSKNWSEEEKHAFYDPLSADFSKNSELFVRGMFPKNADKELVDFVARDMSSASSTIALSAMSELMKTSDAELVKNISVPIKCVNADLWPTNPEANKKLVPSYELSLMKGYGHFIMLEAPEEFNERLGEMIGKIENRE